MGGNFLTIFIFCYLERDCFLLWREEISRYESGRGSYGIGAGGPDVLKWSKMENMMLELVEKKSFRRPRNERTLLTVVDE